MDILCLDFINSRYYLTHSPYVDGLQDPAWQTDFLARWELPDPGPWTPASAAMLAGLRDVLVAGIQDRGDPALLPGLNAALGRSTLRTRLERGPGGFTLSQQPTAAGFDLLIYRIAESFAPLLSGEAAARLKLCQNPDCRWAFLDESKNNSRKWCGPTCSSLIKVRSYRARQRAAGAGQD